MAFGDHLLGIEKRLENLTSKQLYKRMGVEMRKAARLILAGVRAPSRWKRAYVRCLKITDDSSGVHLVLDYRKVSKADGFFARALEEGVPKEGIDMKPWYKHAVNIPIGHSQKKITTQYDAKGSKAALIRQIRALAPGQRMPPATVNKLAGHHVTDPLEGAMRQSGAFTNAAGQKRGRAGSLTAFRRLSPTPPDDPDARERWQKSWIFGKGGRDGAHLMKEMCKVFSEIMIRMSHDTLVGRK